MQEKINFLGIDKLTSSGQPLDTKKFLTLGK